MSALVAVVIEVLIFAVQLALTMVVLAFQLTGWVFLNVVIPGVRGLAALAGSLATRSARRQPRRRDDRDRQKQRRGRSR